MPEDQTLAQIVEQRHTANQIATAKADKIRSEQQVQQQAQIEAQRKQLEQELQQFNIDQNNIKSEIARIEAEEQAKKDAEQKIIDDRIVIKKPFIDRIEQLTKDKETTMNNLSRYEAYFVWKPKTDGAGGSNTNYKSWTNDDGTPRMRLMDRAQYSYLQNQIGKSFNIKLEYESRQLTSAVQQYEFGVKYPGAQLGGSAMRTLRKAGNQLSLIQLYEQQQANFKSRRRAESQRSINTAKADAITSRAKHQQTVEKFAQAKRKKDEEELKRYTGMFNITPTKAGDLKTKSNKPERTLLQIPQGAILPDMGALKSFEKTNQAKIDTLEKLMKERNTPKPEPRRQITSTKSNAFLTKPPPNAKNIIKDNKAIFTFEQTQKQQKKLSELMAGAKNAKEATRIKEEFQLKNPYVGTPQQANTKQGKAQQGVLIDLKIPDIFPDLFPKAYADEGAIIPGTKTETKTITTYNITIGDRTITGIKDEATANKLLERFNRTVESSIPEYHFIDKKGDPYKPTIAELFSYNSYLISQKAQMPNSKDNLFNQILRDNPQAFSFDPSLQSGETKEVNIKNIYDVANKDPLNRGIMNTVVKPGDTVFGKALEDMINYGNATITGSPYPIESETVKNLKDKLKNDFKPSFQGNYKLSAGQKELIGEGIGEYGLLRLFSGAPSLIYKAYESGIVKPHTLKIAEKIAEGIRIEGRDPATEKLIKKFPGLPEAMKKKLRDKTNKETVGIEMLDSRTALIKRGTEFNEVQTPYIIVKTGKNPHSKLYETFTQDKPGAYKEILISGKQNKELTGGIKQTKNIVTYPPTRDNILKTANSDKLAQVGTAEKVGLEGMKERPLAVIEKIETQEVRHGTAILETERLNVIKSMNKDVKGLTKGGDNITTTTKGTKPGPKPTGDKINLSVYKSSDIITIPTKPGSGKIINPVTERRQTLEKIIKATEKETSKNDIQIIGTTAGISLDLGTKTNYISNTKQGIQQSSKQIQTDVIKIDSKITTKQDVTQTTKTGLEEQLKTLQTTRPRIDPKYSLFVTEGLKGKEKTTPLLAEDLDQITDQIISLKIIQEQKQTLIIPIVPETGIPTIPIIPKFGISLPGDKKTNPNPTNKKGKYSKGFFAWNVDTERVGVYLPTRDLSIGKTPKVITRINELQRKTHTRKYAKKITRKIREEFIPKKPGKTKIYQGKTRIINISQPQFRNKKEKKHFEKYFKINFDF